MSLFINGIEVGTTISVDKIDISNVYANNVKVWTAKAPAGSQTFTASGTFIVPEGYTEVTVCMVGAGGSGSCDNSRLYTTPVGAGYAGAVVHQVVSVTPGETISVTIGAGGAKRPTTTSGRVGLAGGSTTFGSLTASGGAGSSNGSANYAGNGTSSVSSCDGTTVFRDGYYYRNTSLDDKGMIEYMYANGGQRSAMGNGGNGSYNTNGNDGGVGAGGGGTFYLNSSSSVYSGAGGRGQCIVTWS